MKQKNKSTKLATNQGSLMIEITAAFKLPDNRTQVPRDNIEISTNENHILRNFTEISFFITIPPLSNLINN